MLSYRPDSVDKDLAAARDRLTGNFRDSYTSLTNDVVIPGAKQQHISAVATVPAAASISADENHSVVMVFVDQTITVGNDPPTGTASAVRGDPRQDRRALADIRIRARLSTDTSWRQNVTRTLPALRWH